MSSFHLKSIECDEEKQDKKIAHHETFNIELYIYLWSLSTAPSKPQREIGG